MTRGSRVGPLIAVAVVGLLGVLGVVDARRGAESGRAWYVATTGTSTGDGTRVHPLDLGTALSTGGPARPGDTIWLTGGTYHGVFVSELTGTKDAPILVRQVPGERAIIDSAPAVETALYVRGAWTTYWGFEVTNSSPQRAGTLPPFNQLTRGIGVEARGPNTKFVNLIVHDMAGGFGIWSDAENAEAYGNIIYYNGFRADDRGHGHGIYVQNLTGERRLTDNIIFSQFGHGIHAYGSSAASLDHITLEGNISFNNGVLDQFYDRNILLGGGQLAHDPVLRRNYTYYNEGPLQGGEINIGYSGGCENLRAEGNYFAGGMALVLGGGCSGSVTDNIFYGSVDGRIAAQYPRNTYLHERPTGTAIFVRPNQYEPGRANIAIYNWDRWRTVSVDLTPARLPRGTKFEIRDAENFFGPPVVTGTYSGRPIAVPMRGLTTASPVRGVDAPPHTAPEFGAFVLLSLSQ